MPCRMPNCVKRLLTLSRCCEGRRPSVATGLLFSDAWAECEHTLNWRTRISMGNRWRKQAHLTCGNRQLCQAVLLKEPGIGDDSPVCNSLEPCNLPELCDSPESCSSPEPRNSPKGERQASARFDEPRESTRRMLQCNRFMVMTSLAYIDRYTAWWAFILINFVA